MTGVFARWSFQFRLLILALAAAIIAMGIWYYPRSSMDALPEFEPAQVEIQTEALGLSALEVEQFITSPMEVDFLNGVAYLDEIRSQSVPGLSSIQLLFEPGTDLPRARQLVAERLVQAHSLPKVSTPPVLMQPKSSTSRVMMVRLSSSEVPLIDMSVLARWNIRPRLMGVPGVANLSIWGQREQQMQVEVDPQALQARGVTLNQVIRTTGNAVWVSPLTFLQASTPGTGGFLETENQRLGIQHVLPITTPSDLAKVSVENVTGPPLVLGDVATVREYHQPLIGDAVVDEDPALMLVIEKFPEANTAEITAALEAALEDLKPGLSGINVDTSVYRPASFLESALQNLGTGFLVGLLLAALLLGLLFKSWRTALVGLIVLAVSTAAAFLMLSVVGIGLNVLVFAGLVLALVVVVTDLVTDLNGLRRRRELSSDSGLPAAVDGRDRGNTEDGLSGSGVKAEPRLALITAALQQTRNAIVFAGLTMALVLLPVLFLTGVNRALFVPLVLSFLLALAVALLIAWLLTPALALTFMAGEGQPPRWPGKIREGTRKAVERSAAKSRWVVAAAALFAVAAAAGIPLLATGQPSVTALQDRILLVQWDGLAGTSNGEMGRISALASKELTTLPGVANVGGHVGRAITSDRVVGPNSGELWVTMEADADYSSVTEAVNEVVAGYPGIRGGVATYGQNRLDVERNRSQHEFSVRVFGVDPQVLRQTAENVRDMMSSTAGLVDPQLSLPRLQPIAEIEVDLDKAQQAGVKPGDVRRAAATLLQGVDVGFLFEQQKVFQVVVKGTPATSSSLTSVQELLIDKPDGGHVRLSEVADVRVTPHESVITHTDTSRHIDVVAQVDGRSVGDITSDVNAGLANLDFPMEYHAQVPSRYSEQQSTVQLVWTVAGAALIGILVLLQTALGSWRVALVVFLALPLALVGGVLGAILTGGISSLVTLLAFVALFGMAVRDSILLVRRAQTPVMTSNPVSAEAREEAQLRGGSRSSILQAAQERLVPLVIAAVVSTAFLIPLVVLGGAVGRETILPLAIVVWGGLVTHALFVLIVLPTLLILFGTGTPEDEDPLKPQGPADAAGLAERTEVP
ncbi:efflux RND transporter permease subunit [Pseudarthrobacter sp. NS4]|uniref:efflux RND transporter permease subunit n=1 Tax=Pseudarthrobacter sp. NS4 TaxID=2973976 RepID=UPI0021631C3C|nr:efflux RND transporter permease subunit [Pseudarthrobacter sp. NS4]